MRTPLFQTATVLLALSSTASAQFSAALDSGQWSSRSAGQRSSRWPGPQEHGDFGYSDCVSENSLGLTNGGQIAWFQGFYTPPCTTVTSVNVANGTTTGSGAPAGNAGAVYVYDDPGEDFTDPTDLGAPVVSTSWITMSPNTDIKEPQSVSGAEVSHGFWLAAHMTQLAGEFPAAFDSDTPSNGTSWVSGSNTTFDPTNPGGGIGFFEMSALGFDSVWLMSSDANGAGFQKYCTAKSGLVCGLPKIGWSGLPVPGRSSGFLITADPARANRSGLLLYSCSGRAALPFEGGFLCVNPAPLRRVPPVNSGTAVGACDGVFSVDWNTFASGNGGGNPDPCVMQSGQQVNAQWWGRDSLATGSFLSNAVEFVNS